MNFVSFIAKGDVAFGVQSTEINVYSFEKEDITCLRSIYSIIQII